MPTQTLLDPIPPCTPPPPPGLTVPKGFAKTYIRSPREALVEVREGSVAIYVDETGIVLKSTEDIGLLNVPVSLWSLHRDEKGKPVFPMVVTLEYKRDRIQERLNTILRFTKNRTHPVILFDAIWDMRCMGLVMVIPKEDFDSEGW